MEKNLVVSEVGGVPQGWLFGPVLFILHDKDLKLALPASESADDIRTGCEIISYNGYRIISNLDKLWSWS